MLRLPSVRTLQGFRQAIKRWRASGTREFHLNNVRLRDQTGTTSPEEELLHPEDQPPGWLESIKSIGTPLVSSY